MRFFEDSFRGFSVVKIENFCNIVGVIGAFFNGARGVCDLGVFVPFRCGIVVTASGGRPVLVVSESREFFVWVAFPADELAGKGEAEKAVHMCA